MVEINSMHHGSIVECWPLDLASFKSIKSFARRFESSDLDDLHVLIQNACVIPAEYRVTEDGYESGSVASSRLDACT